MIVVSGDYVLGVVYYVAVANGYTALVRMSAETVMDLLTFLKPNPHLHSMPALLAAPATRSRPWHRTPGWNSLFLCLSLSKRT